MAKDKRTANMDNNMAKYITACNVRYTGCLVISFTRCKPKKRWCLQWVKYTKNSSRKFASLIDCNEHPHDIKSFLYLLQWTKKIEIYSLGADVSCG